MQIITDIGAQGDVTFYRPDLLTPAAWKGLPEGCRPGQKTPEGMLVTYSANGHHHLVQNAPEGVILLEHPTNPLIAYLKMPPSSTADLVHVGGGHETLRMVAASDRETVFEIHRQREMSPSGWVQVQD